MRFPAWPLFGLILLCGCADPARDPFDPTAAAIVHDHGASSIEGQAFAVDAKGYVIHASGQRVFLFPGTPYVRERFAARFFGSHELPVWVPDLFAADPRLRDFSRTTVADANGKFRFDDLVPGTYVIASQVSWQLENRLLPDGKQMFTTVLVTGTEKEPVKVVLSGA
jgi:hypothetical protein